MQEFFYDAQIRRYLVQFIRIFSSLQIQVSTDKGAGVEYKQVPIIYGDPSRMAAHILSGGSANTALPVPMMAATIKDLSLAPKRRRDPKLENNVYGIEREFVDGDYTSNPGNRFTVGRYMPVPYDITFQLDIWTSSTETKLQLLEQIMMIFNPSLQLQQNSNPFDWTSIFEIELSDISWTNITLPTTEDGRNVATLLFKAEIWINPPAKITRQKIIEQIVSNVNATHTIGNEIDLDTFTLCNIDQNVDRIRQFITTPEQLHTDINNVNGTDVITLLNDDGEFSEITWKEVFTIYQVPGNSVDVTLLLSDDVENFEDVLVGNVSISDTNTARINITNPHLDNAIDVISIVDPTTAWPGNGLAIAEFGQSYIITSANSAGEEPAFPETDAHWGEVSAYPNDIITYTGTAWVVTFDSNVESTGYAVINNIMYHYKNRKWEPLYNKHYSPGFWRIFDDSNAPDGNLNNGCCG